MHDSFSADEAYSICMRAVHSEDAKRLVNEHWQELADANSLFRGMKVCDSLCRIFTDEFEKDSLFVDAESDKSYLKAIYLARLGLDHAYNEESYGFPSNTSRYSYYICRSRLHQRYGHLLLKTKRFYATNEELQMARDDLYRAMNCILDDYMSTESMVPYTPCPSQIVESGKTYHQLAFERKCRLVKDALDRMVTPIEKDIDICIDELMGFIPKGVRDQLSRLHLKETRVQIEISKTLGSSQARMVFLERMERRIISAYPEINGDSEYHQKKYMRSEMLKETVPYTNWSIQNNLVLKFTDPVVRNLYPSMCHDEVFYQTNRESWLKYLFNDIIRTFGHARFLLYKYSIVKQRTNDLRFPEPDRRGFYLRLEGKYSLEDDSLYVEYVNRIHRDSRIEEAVAAKYEITPDFIRFEEEMLMDAFVRLYSILDKISQMVVREFSIQLYDPWNNRTAKPSMGVLAHSLHDNIDDDDDESRFLKILEIIYAEINPGSLDKNTNYAYDERIHYDSMPFAQTLYNIRNHIVHSEMRVTYQRPMLGEKKKEGTISSRDLYENTIRLAHIVKEAIMTTMLALECRDRSNRGILERGRFRWC